jgi:thiamine-monophosphate kinase
MDAEGQLIGRIAKIVGTAKGRGASLTRIGIGDDAAVLQPRAGKELVLTCDSFFEGVHFLADVHPAESVGYKSLARATSDIAAMGARPRWFLLALGLPRSKTGRWLDRFSAGMGRAAGELGVRLIGGDTSRLANVAITITVVGEIAPGKAIRRTGARSGDFIYVSGRLGEAQLGLAIRGRKIDFVGQHLYPRIPVALGEWLAGHRVATAMMDISDGLSIDLARLCKASGVGARIEAARLPCVEVPRQLPAALRRARLDPLAMALHGGDDYVLLFAVPRRKAAMLRRAPGAGGMACIGEITREREILLIDAHGRAKALASRGWDPFRSR